MKILVILAFTLAMTLTGTIVVAEGQFCMRSADCYVGEVCVMDTPTSATGHCRVGK